MENKSIEMKKLGSKVRIQTVFIDRPKYRKRSNGRIYKLNNMQQWECVVKK